MRSASLLFLLLFNWIEVFSQNYIINGYVEDSKTGERLIGAMICDSVSRSGSNSNFYGYYTIKCSSRSVNLVASYLGYKTSKITFSLVNDTVLNIFLQPQAYNLAEVIIDDKKRLIESSRMSTSVLSVSTIKQVPMLMG